jgi:hypothetical protein
VSTRSVPSSRSRGCSARQQAPAASAWWHVHAPALSIVRSENVRRPAPVPRSPRIGCRPTCRYSRATCSRRCGRCRVGVDEVARQRRVPDDALQVEPQAAERHQRPLVLVGHLGHRGVGEPRAEHPREGLAGTAPSRRPRAGSAAPCRARATTPAPRIGPAEVIGARRPARAPPRAPRSGTRRPARAAAMGSSSHTKYRRFCWRGDSALGLGRQERPELERLVHAVERGELERREPQRREVGGRARRGAGSRPGAPPGPARRGRGARPPPLPPTIVGSASRPSSDVSARSWAARLSPMPGDPGGCRRPCRRRAREQLGHAVGQHPELAAHGLGVVQDSRSPDRTTARRGRRAGRGPLSPETTHTSWPAAVAFAVSDARTSSASASALRTTRKPCATTNSSNRGSCARRSSGMGGRPLL